MGRLGVHVSDIQLQAFIETLDVNMMKHELIEITQQLEKEEAHQQEIAASVESIEKGSVPVVRRRSSINAAQVQQARSSILVRQEMEADNQRALERSMKINE